MVKAIYGMKCLQQIWKKTFYEFVCFIKFQILNFDPCLYLKSAGRECVLLLVYIIDVLVTGSSTEVIAHTKS